MARLDRRRDFGTISGSAPWAHEQDGKLFNSAGQEVTATGEVLPDEPSAATAPAPAAARITMRDGTHADIGAMAAPALRALADELGLKLHPNTGEAKARAALLEAFPYQGAADEVDRQLEA